MLPILLSSFFFSKNFSISWDVFPVVYGKMLKKWKKKEEKWVRRIRINKHQRTVNKVSKKSQKTKEVKWKEYFLAGRHDPRSRNKVYTELDPVWRWKLIMEWK